MTVNRAPCIGPLALFQPRPDLCGRSRPKVPSLTGLRPDHLRVSNLPAMVLNFDAEIMFTGSRFSSE